MSSSSSSGVFLRDVVEIHVLSVWRRRELFQRCFLPKFLVHESLFSKAPFDMG
jgi:hypothetical protein